jgi:hypothetical protein
VAGSLLAALSACQNFEQKQGPGADGGFVELDENTDPRFIHYDRTGSIGRLRVAGTNVYLNGALVDRDQRLPNDAWVRTGPASGVRAELAPGTGSRCQIAVQQFHQGRLYGESATCLHEVGTDQGTARTERTLTTYHANAQNDRTTLTVIEGEMRAWPTGAPSRGVVVGPMQEVQLRPGAVLGPRPVTERQVSERTAWRAGFDWDGRGQAASACNRYAAMAVEQNDENRKRSCGYTGARWQSEPEYHFRWCIEDNNQRLADRETEARARALEECGRADQGSRAIDVLLPMLFQVFSHSQRPRHPSTTDTGPAPSGESAPPPAGPSETAPPAVVVPPTPPPSVIR